MRMLLASLIGILSFLAFSSRQFGWSDTELVFPLKSPAGFTAAIELGFEDRAGLLTSYESGNTTTYSDGNYEIQITETPSSAKNIVRVVVKKMSGEAFRLNSLSLTGRVYRSAVEGIWYPGADPSSTNVMAANPNQSIDEVADANFGIPYVATASADSRNVFAIGLLRQDLAVAINGEPAGASYQLWLKTLTGRTSVIFDESFYISADTSQNWFETAAEYADWVDAGNNYQQFPVSPRAYEPLYDAWYWSGDRVDELLYLDTAYLASELGIGLYLADSGWDSEEGEYERWLAGKTGDYTPPPSKFSNLAETFGIIRSEGNLAIELWLQPFAVGRESMRYSATRDMHIHVPVRRYASMGWGGLAYEPFALPWGSNLETVNLCPRLSSTQTYLEDLFTEIATTYQPEGYWLDFIDGIASYCVAPHAHTYPLFGEGLRRSLQTIKDTILSHDPNAIVHFRARYANLNTKSFANIWQSGDSPGDFDQMRLNSIRLRPFSKGVVFAADQMYWPDGTPEADVSKFVMTSLMTGVPAFGPTLLYSPPETLAIMKAWLGFYRQNQTEIATGKFSTFGALAIPNHKIESAGRTFAYMRNLDFSELKASGRTIFLMNATDADQFRGSVRPPRHIPSFQMRILDRYLVPEAHEFLVSVDSEGLLQLDVEVQQGGMIVLTPDESVSLRSQN